MQVDGSVIIKSLDNILQAAEKDKMDSARVLVGKSAEYQMAYIAGLNSAHNSWREKVSKFRSMLTIFFGA